MTTGYRRPAPASVYRLHTTGSCCDVAQTPESVALSDSALASQARLLIKVSGIAAATFSDVLIDFESARR